MSKIIPLEDFFRNTPESFYSISPDGKNFAFLAPYHDRMNIFVRPCCFTQNAENSEPVQLTFETSRSIEGYAWVDNERILFVHTGSMPLAIDGLEDLDVSDQKD